MLNSFFTVTKWVTKLINHGHDYRLQNQTARRVVFSNIVYLCLPIVYFIFLIIDFKAYLQSIFTLRFDQFMVPIIIAICYICLFLNKFNYSLLSRCLFLLAWPLLMHIIPIWLLHSPSDYILAFPAGLIFHSMLIQLMLSNKEEPLFYFILLIANFLTMYFAREILTYYDTEKFLPQDPSFYSYYRLDSILYWLLFNLVIFYTVFELERRTIEIQAKNLYLAEYNEELTTRENEITAQNEELLQHQEEINSQRDLLNLQNIKLIESQHTIEWKNQEIHKKNQNLEYEVELRTKELVEYTQQLEQFAYITAHNLRAPVARILGLGQLITLKLVVENEEKEIINKLLKTTIELDEVIKDLNSILEIKKNNTEIYEKVSLSNTIQKVELGLQKEIEETNTEIKTDLSAISVINAFPAYLYSIIYNLVSNSIKYRHPLRPPNIRIKTEMVNGLVCLSIEDNGIGIDLDNQGKHIFNLYKRFHFHVEGKGIGLYLVKTQVESLGGRITVESEINKGTIFNIYLKA